MVDDLNGPVPVLGPVEELRRRFVHSPELDLLYDRRSGLEHHLDATGTAFVEATFGEADPVSALVSRFRVSRDVIATDLGEFWQARLTDPQRRHPARRGGTHPRWAAARVPFPLALEIEVTRACNWHCVFCFNTWKETDAQGRRTPSETGTGPAVHMPLDTVRAIVDEAVAQGCVRLRLSGGEPTLHPRYQEIISLAGASGLEVELFTNGTRLTVPGARWLRTAGVRVVLLSLHGLADAHNSVALNPSAFRRAWQAISASTAAGLTTVVETLVHEQALAEIPDMVARLAATGVRHVSFMPYVAHGPGDPRRPVPLQRIADLIDECSAAVAGKVAFRVPCSPRHCLREDPEPIRDVARPEFDNHCGAGVVWASVSYDGGVRHCPHSDVFAGMVADGITRVWREVLSPTVRAAAAAGPECRGCTQIEACRGGCHLNRILAYPDHRRQQPASSPTTANASEQR